MMGRILYKESQGAYHYFRFGASTVNTKLSYCKIFLGVYRKVSTSQLRPTHFHFPSFIAA